MESVSDSVEGELPEGRIQGAEAFSDLVRRALAQAASDRWNHLILSDPDFTDWPLGERAVIESLNAWAGGGRHVQFLAKDFGRLRERHPRLVQWRVTWSHVVDARACRDSSGDAVPSAIWTPRWCMERIDLDRSVVVATSLPQRRAALFERLQSAWQRGTPSFSASTLGL